MCITGTVVLDVGSAVDMVVLGYSSGTFFAAIAEGSSYAARTMSALALAWPPMPSKIMMVVISTTLTEAGLPSSQAVPAD